MNNNTRLRFAPSPTGFLHVGSLRMVLFDYLIAKKLNGKLILRIEDTDQKREVEGAAQAIVDILDWIGINFDEGPGIDSEMAEKYGPYIQTQRLDIYKKYADKLIEEGKAYRCFCTQERLQEMREKQQAEKLPPRYDRKCRDLSQEEIDEKIKNGEKFVIRQKMPLTGEIKVHDELRGEIKFRAEDMDDHVLIKADGVPTYQFASVVDDHLMEMSHVVRGEEWIPSFPKNVLLYQAFDWQVPKFIHMPLTLNKEGGKLSKRQGDVAVEDYREKGYLPEAILNFSVLLGWHPKDEQEILSLDEMIAKFEIKDIRTSGAVFDIEKLDYFNGYYIRQKTLDELTELCKPFLKNNLAKAKESKKADNFLKGVVRLEQERMKKLSDIEEATKFFFVEKLDYDRELLLWKKLTMEEVQVNLAKIYELLEKIPEENWTNDSIEECLITYIKAKEEKVGNFLWPMRVALTGEKASPGPFDVAEVLGREESLRRIGDLIKN